MKKWLIGFMAIVGIGAAALSAQASIFDKPLYDTGKPVANRPMAFVDFKELAGAHPAPDLAFKGLDGKTHKLSDFRGNLLIVDMWATWCSPCQRTIPLILDLQKSLKKDKAAKVKFVSVSVDETEEDVRDFIEDNHLQAYDTWLDPKKTILQVIPSDVVPTAFFFDGRGNLVGFVRGYVDWTGMGVEDFLKRLGDKYADPSGIKPRVKPPVLLTSSSP